MATSLEGKVAVVTGASRAVVFVLTRPRDHRILTLSLRPVGEPSWG